jgi:hypothetical protein
MPLFTAAVGFKITNKNCNKNYTEEIKNNRDKYNIKCYKKEGLGYLKRMI